VKKFVVDNIGPWGDLVVKYNLSSFISDWRVPALERGSHQPRRQTPDQKHSLSCRQRQSLCPRKLRAKSPGRNLLIWSMFEIPNLLENYELNCKRETDYLIGSNLYVPSLSIGTRTILKPGRKSAVGFQKCLMVLSFCA
jgi:hypothetical protein